MEFYLYKEFCDGDAYGEEITEGYAEKDDALNHLRVRAEEYFGVPYDKIPEVLGPEDEFREGYICAYSGKGYMFWIVQERKMKGQTRPEWHLRNAIDELKKSESREALTDILGMTSKEATEYGL